jgi:hypothetical protein
MDEEMRGKYFLSSAMEEGDVLLWNVPQSKKVLRLALRPKAIQRMRLWQKYLRRKRLMGEGRTMGDEERSLLVLKKAKMRREREKMHVLVKRRKRRDSLK